MALLSPVAERPSVFAVGDPSFDAKNAGIISRPAKPGSDYDEDGYFIMDTTKKANSNAGHEFADGKSPGIIGPALKQDEKEALVEFLKTL